MNNIVSTNACEIARLGRGRWADFLGVDGVDLFEFHEVVTVASRFSRVVSVWILLVCSTLLLSFGVVLFLMLSYHFPLGPTLWSAIAAYLLAASVTLLMGGAAGRIWRSAGACRTQPFHPRTRALVLVATMVYIVLLHFCPAPSTWGWSLAVIHTTRALKVLASLRGQDNGVVDTAGVEDIWDML